MNGRRLMVWAGLAALVSAAQAQPGSVPLIYCTDLFHPHDDPDDHFDLATVFALEEFDLRAVVLDQGRRQAEASGLTPLRQMAAITGRELPPCAAGLPEPLTSPEDDGSAQPAEYQGAAKLILDALWESEKPVTLFITGSCRDVAAAYNRDPDLFAERVGRLYINAGYYQGELFEYNVKLDEHAYDRLTKSDLRIYWCPCFAGDQAWRTGPHGTWWHFQQGPLFDRLAAPAQAFFVYALLRLPTAVDPLTAVADAGLLDRMDADWRAQIWAAHRNMWCTAPLLHAAGRSVQPAAAGGWQMVRLGEDTEEPVYHFVPFMTPPVQERFEGVWYRIPPEAIPGRLFEVKDEAAYPQAMTECLAQLLGTLGR